MATSPLFEGTARTSQALFVPAFAQRPRVLWDAGALGSRIVHINLSNTDGSQQTPQFYVGKPLTLQADMGVGALVDNGGSPDHITRTEGSFIEDGWQVGDRLFVRDPTTLANGFSVLVTSVAATTLALAAGGGTVDTAESLPAGAELMRLTSLHSIDVAAAAGTSGNAALSGLDETQLPGLSAGTARELILGPDTALLAALSATLDSGETFDVTCFGFDY